MAWQQHQASGMLAPTGRSECLCLSWQHGLERHPAMLQRELQLLQASRWYVWPRIEHCESVALDQGCRQKGAAREGRQQGRRIRCVAVAKPGEASRQLLR